MNQVEETIRDDSADQPQILVMEDESSVAQGLQMVLTEEGYGVDLAMTGQSALDTLSHKGFDLLVADLRLPDMDGMEVIKRVKGERPETGVIVITGYASVPSAVEAMKTGIVDYLPKPFTEDEFKARVERALKEKKHVHTKEHVKPPGTKEEKLIQKREVIRVLKRAPEDDDFHTALIEEKWMQTAEELAKTFNFQKNLIESSIDGIMACDKDGKIIIFNKSLEKMLGYSQNEVCGKVSFNQFFQVGDAEKFKEKLYSEEYGGKSRLFLFETNLVSKTGDRIPAQLSATVMFEEDEEIGMVTFLRDLREIRELEQEFADQAPLLQQHRMISLGRLSASVVHEINNPLAGILNYLRLMIKIINRDSLGQEHIEKFQRYLDIVESETSRCSKIASNLLAFSRKSKLEFSEVSIHELLEKSIMLNQHKLDLQNIQIRTELEEKIPAVWGDFNQIQQCVINLILNSIDAMPDGGTLTMESSFNREKGVVEIRVEDTGCGIAKEDLPNIFDPFFTTKKEGKGIGLGLSTVYGFIDRHKGIISVDSKLGKGTVFTIQLPIVIGGRP